MQPSLGILIALLLYAASVATVGLYFKSQLNECRFANCPSRFATPCNGQHTCSLALGDAERAEVNAADEAKAAAAALRFANRELAELRGKLLNLQKQDGTNRKECARVDATGMISTLPQKKPEPLMFSPQPLTL
jgi:hypothetical protein